MTRGYIARAHQWLRTDIDRVFAALVCSALGAVSLAGSATHVLHVGAYPEVNVTGWMVWTVAGSLEALAAYAAWEVRRRLGWDRLLPALVFAASVGFIILANLAASDQRSWAARLPWAEAFSVAPPIAFFSVAAIAETRGWSPPRRRSPKPGTRAISGSTSTKTLKRTGGTEQMAGASGKAASESDGPGARYRILVQPLVQPGETRKSTVERWVREGHSWKSMVEAGTALLNVSATTMKREIRGARVGEHTQP